MFRGSACRAGAIVQSQVTFMHNIKLTQYCSISTKKHAVP